MSRPVTEERCGDRGGWGVVFPGAPWHAPVRLAAVAVAVTATRCSRLRTLASLPPPLPPDLLSAPISARRGRASVAPFAHTIVPTPAHWHGGRLGWSEAPEAWVPRLLPPLMPGPARRWLGRGPRSAGRDPACGGGGGCGDGGRSRAEVGRSTDRPQCRAGSGRARGGRGGGGGARGSNN